MTKVLLRQRIRDTVLIDHLALCKRNVDRVGDSVCEVLEIEV